MINKFRNIILLAGGILIAGYSFQSCYYDNKEELYGLNVCDTSSVSFNTDILPMLESQCYICHSSANSDALGGGNSLEGFDNLINFVEPNDPLNSLLYQDVAWLPGANHMPKSGQQLDDCTLAKIRIWISNGATNN